jgi:hypothetical protein
VFLFKWETVAQRPLRVALPIFPLRQPELRLLFSLRARRTVRREELELVPQSVARGVAVAQVPRRQRHFMVLRCSLLLPGRTAALAAQWLAVLAQASLMAALVFLYQEVLAAAVKPAVTLLVVTSRARASFPRYRAALLVLMSAALGYFLQSRGSRRAARAVVRRIPRQQLAATAAMLAGSAAEAVEVVLA